MNPGFIKQKTNSSIYSAKSTPQKLNLIPKSASFQNLIDSSKSIQNLSFFDNQTDGKQIPKDGDEGIDQPETQRDILSVRMSLLNRSQFSNYN